MPSFGIVRCLMGLEFIVFLALLGLSIAQLRMADGKVDKHSSFVGGFLAASFAFFRCCMLCCISLSQRDEERLKINYGGVKVLSYLTFFALAVCISTSIFIATNLGHEESGHPGTYKDITTALLVFNIMEVLSMILTIAFFYCQSNIM